jgi:hypothetical protein
VLADQSSPHRTYPWLGILLVQNTTASSTSYWRKPTIHVRLHPSNEYENGRSWHEWARTLSATGPYLPFSNYAKQTGHIATFLAPPTLAFIDCQVVRNYTYSDFYRRNIANCTLESDQHNNAAIIPSHPTHQRLDNPRLCPTGRPPSRRHPMPLSLHPRGRKTNPLHIHGLTQARLAHRKLLCIRTQSQIALCQPRHRFQDPIYQSPTAE